MPRPKAPRNIRRPYGLTLLSGLSAVFLLGCAILTLQVYVTLDDLTAAQSDNIDYTIGRLEVEHVKLQAATERLERGEPGAVALFRRRFDVLTVKPIRWGQASFTPMRCQPQRCATRWSGSLPALMRWCRWSMATTAR